MEKPSSITMYYSLLLEPAVGLFFLLNLVMISASKLLSKSFNSFCAGLFAVSPYNNYPYHNQQNVPQKCRGRDVVLSKEEIECIISKIGIRFDAADGGEQPREVTGIDEISGLFEEVEPSLEEAKEAFFVFDQNKDGFIDAEELQKALLKLGFIREKELEISECREMIAAYDLNNDARIDFMEFVRFLEASFC